MALAELEVYHSRPIAPTRRVALGRRVLPVSPAPGAGGLLLAGIVAGFLPDVDPDLHDDVRRLTRQLERGERVPQPRLRHRFQQDLVGLTRSTHRLLDTPDGLRYQLQTDTGAPAQHVLGALYAAGGLPTSARGEVMRLLRRAMAWTGSVDQAFLAFVGARNGHARALADPLAWAMEVLGFDGGTDGTPDRTEVQQRFRSLLRVAHPDHGGQAEHAARRIAELTEARRILLA